MSNSPVPQNLLSCPVHQSALAGSQSQVWELLPHPPFPSPYFSPLPPSLPQIISFSSSGRGSLLQLPSAFVQHTPHPCRCSSPLAVPSQRRTPMGGLGQAVVRTPQEPHCTARPPSTPARPARPQLGLAKTCFLLLRTSHTVRPQQGDFHLPLPGAEELSPKAPDKYTDSSLSGWLMTDFALEPGRDFWAFEAKKQ